MLKRLIEWIKGLFAGASKSTGTSTPNLTPTPPAVKVFDLKTKEGWEAYRENFVPSTRAYVPTWDQKERIDGLIAAAAASGPIDRATFNLGQGDGWVTVNTLANDQLYPYSYEPRAGQSGEIYVYGAEGSELHAVNGQSVLPEKRAIIPADGSGKITLSVRSAGGRIAVQFRQS